VAVGTEKEAKATGRDLHELFKDVFALQAILADIKDQVHEQAGMGSPHKKVAEILRDKGAATVPEVASSLQVSRQFVQTVCNQLEREGLLRFSPNPRHKRSRLASLTREGRKVMAMVRRREEAIIKKGLPAVERQGVIQASQTLRCLAGHLKKFTGPEA